MRICCASASCSGPKSFSKSERPSLRQSVSPTATTFAWRGSSSISAISPKWSPRPSVMSSFSVPSTLLCVHFTAPDSTRKKSSPASPSRRMYVPSGNGPTGTSARPIASTCSGLSPSRILTCLRNATLVLSCAWWPSTAILRKVASPTAQSVQSAVARIVAARGAP